MTIINPLSDRRWEDFAARHAHASVFHQPGWLEALRRTYGYKPLILTSTRDGQPLSDGIALCRVSSWMTGTRLVSLPFADHCQPLLGDPHASGEFMEWLRAECGRRRWRYVQIRPLAGGEAGYGFEEDGSYCFHELDLSPSLGNIFQKLHKNSFQRKIRRAEKENLTYHAGRSQELLNEFYRLVVATRRRHQLLPQPRAWFRNLADCMGERLEIRVARKNGIPIAAILSLRHRGCVVYKYGGSQASFHNLGAMPLLFWKMIEEAKASGAERIDLGRSDLDQQSLITFKDRMGARRRLLTYYRHTDSRKAKPAPTRNAPGLREVLFVLPDLVLSTAGRMMYRHMG